MKKSNWVGLLPYYLLVAILCVGGASLSSGAVTAYNQNAPVEREHTIIVDAGHGGIDGGATSCTGVLESAFNLEIALRMNDLLHFLGYDTVMIRTTDTSIYTEGNTIAAQKVSDLKERVRICNETEGGILLSIHQNTFSDSRYGGAQVFYANTQGSRELAQRLQTAFCSTINPGSNRKCKTGKSVYLLEHIDCTGILVECGFLSNAEEEARLRDTGYQQYLCAVIAQALGDYINS